MVREVFASLADDAPSQERWLGLTTELTLHVLRDPEAMTAWAAEQRRIRSALVEAVDEAVTRRGAALGPTHRAVRARHARLGERGAMTSVGPNRAVWPPASWSPPC